MVRDSHDRIALGKPRQMHFRDTATEIIPELRGRLAKRNAVGKISIEVHTAELADVKTAFQCNVAAVIFLNRHAGGPARLLPLSTEDAFGRLERDLPLFQEPLHEKNRASLRHLVEAGSYELCYRDLEEAATLLKSLVS